MWQFACRENDIPEVGDHVVYEIVRDSYLVIRTAPDEIKAYPNACLHRGRRLKDHDGRCEEIRCPFHGFTWALDGALKRVPAEWDFAHIDPDDFTLPEAAGRHVGRVRLDQPRPRRRTARGLPRRTSSTTSTSGTWATATRRPTSPR